MQFSQIEFVTNYKLLKDICQCICIFARMIFNYIFIIVSHVVLWFKSQIFGKKMKDKGDFTSEYALLHQVPERKIYIYILYVFAVVQ